MRTNDISIDNLDQPELLEELDGPPECSLTGPGALGDMSLFRVDSAVVGPQPEELEGHAALFSRHAQDVTETAQDVVMLLKEELR